MYHIESKLLLLQVAYHYIFAALRGYSFTYLFREISNSIKYKIYYKLDLYVNKNIT
jgi:hypothetical protein